MDMRDARAQVVDLEKKQIEARQRGETLRNPPAAAPVQGLGTTELVVYLSLFFALVIGLGFAVIWVVMRLTVEN